MQRWGYACCSVISRDPSPSSLHRTRSRENQKTKNKRNPTALDGDPPTRSKKSDGNQRDAMGRLDADLKTAKVDGGWVRRSLEHGAAGLGVFSREEEVEVEEARRGS